MKYTVHFEKETMEFVNWIFFASWFDKLNAENDNLYNWAWEDVHDRIVKVYEKKSLTTVTLNDIIRRTNERKENKL